MSLRRAGGGAGARWRRPDRTTTRVDQRASRYRARPRSAGMFSSLLLPVPSQKLLPRRRRRAPRPRPRPPGFSPASRGLHAASNPTLPLSNARGRLPTRRPGTRGSRPSTSVSSFGNSVGVSDKQIAHGAEPAEGHPAPAEVQGRERRAHRRRARLFARRRAVATYRSRPSTRAAASPMPPISSFPNSDRALQRRPEREPHERRGADGAQTVRADVHGFQLAARARAASAFAPSSPIALSLKFQGVHRAEIARERDRALGADPAPDQATGIAPAKPPPRALPPPANATRAGVAELRAVQNQAPSGPGVPAPRSPRLPLPLRLPLRPPLQATARSPSSKSPAPRVRRERRVREIEDVDARRRGEPPPDRGAQRRPRASPPRARDASNPPAKTRAVAHQATIPASPRFGLRDRLTLSSVAPRARMANGVAQRARAVVADAFVLQIDRSQRRARGDPRRERSHAVVAERVVADAQGSQRRVRRERVRERARGLRVHRVPGRVQLEQVRVRLQRVRDRGGLVGAERASRGTRSRTSSSGRRSRACPPTTRRRRRCPTPSCAAGGRDAK